MAGNNVKAREQKPAFGEKNVQGFQTAKNASMLKLLDFVK